MFIVWVSNGEERCRWTSNSIRNRLVQNTRIHKI